MAACTAESQVHLAAGSCDPTRAQPNDTTSAPLTVPVSTSRSSASKPGGIFTAVLDVAPLEVGRTYHLCLDVDGPADAFTAGDTGFLIHASPVLQVLPRTVDRVTSQRFSFTCSGGCSPESTVYLSLIACSPHERDITDLDAARQIQSDTLLFVGDNKYTAMLDTSLLSIGAHYHLCMDMDGTGSRFGFGTTARVYVRGVTDTSSAALTTSALTTLRLVCKKGCSQTSMLSVSTACERVDIGVVHRAVAGKRSPSAAFVRVADGFTAKVDATMLTLGVHYRLCTDLDGVGGSHMLGDSGIKLFVSPAEQCISCIVHPSPGEQLLLSCPNCSQSTQVFLAESTCDDGPLIEVHGPHSRTFTTVGTPNLTVFDDTCIFSPGSTCEFQVDNGTNMIPAEEDGSNRTTASALAHAGRGTWAAEVDASKLQAGSHYLVCLNLGSSADGRQYITEDGNTSLRKATTTGYEFGDTSLRTYITPITSVSPLAVPKGRFRLSTSCETSRGCHNGARMWLAKPDVGCSAANSRAASGILNAGPTSTAFIGPLSGFVDLDASTFDYGASLRLCTTWRSLSVIGDTGVELYVTPISNVKPQAVAAQPRQRLKVTCAGGCSTRSRLYLAANCDPSTPRATLFAHLEFPDRYTAAASRNVWFVNLDATGLTPGTTWALCADVDGDASGSSPGHTGVNIYVKGLSSTTLGIEAAAGQSLSVRCTAGCKRAAGSVHAYLARDCAAPTETDMFVSDWFADGEWSFTVNAAGLSTGYLHRLCATLDTAVEKPPYIDTALVVYMTPFNEVRPGWVVPSSGSTSKLRLRCSGGRCPSSQTRVRLATACDGEVAHVAEVLPMPSAEGGGDALIAELSTSALVVGQHYRLCVVLDGDFEPLGDTGLELYISGVEQPLLPASFQAAPAQRVCFACAQCSARTTAFVGVSCGGSGRSVSGDMDRSNVNALFREERSGKKLWCVVLDASHLQVGNSYDLCVDIDGAASSFHAGRTGKLFIAPALLLAGGVQPSSLVAGSGVGILRIQCSSLSCSQRSTAFLSNSCDADVWVSSVVRTLQSSLEIVAGAGGSSWLFTANTSALIPGLLFYVCLDVDGLGAAFSPGDSGLRVYASGVTAHPAAVYPARAQRFEIGCAACSTASTARLSLDACDRSTGMGTSGAEQRLSSTGQKHRYFFGLDAHALQIGMNYKLCVDLDGNGGALEPGDSGAVYVSTARSLRPTTVRAAAGQHLSFDCSACRIDSTLYLSEWCDGTQKYPGPDIGVITKTAQRTTAVRIAPDASNAALPGVGNAARWRASLDATQLSEGASYQLCMDLDGRLPNMPAGDTGLAVYVTPVQSVATRTLLHASGQQINLVCASCLPGVATVTLADSCGTTGTTASPSAKLIADVPDRTGTARRSTLDATSLVPGRSYELCVDLDGEAGELVPGSAAQVSITPLYAAEPSAVRQQPGQRVAVRCDRCSTLSRVHLAKSCAAEGVQATPSQPLRAVGMAVTGADRWFDFMFDASHLTRGTAYLLCLDLDGPGKTFSAIETGILIHVTAVYESATQSVAPAAQQLVQVKCEATACSSRATLVLATGACDVTDTGGLTLSRPPSLSAASVLIPARGSTPSQSPVPGAMSTPGTWLETSVDATQLKAGARYRICVDLDGTGPLGLGDTGLALLVSPFVCSSSGLQSSASTATLVAPAAGQTIEMACVAAASSACSSAVGYLGKTCNAADAQGSPAARRSWSSGIASVVASKTGHGEANPLWRLKVDASNLEPGTVYQVCLAADGVRTGSFEDTGCRAYVAGITAVEPASFQAGRAGMHRFVLHCNNAGGCRPGLPVALCDQRALGAKVIRRTEPAVLTRTGSVWEVTLNIAGLSVGSYYQLCVGQGQASTDQAYLPTGLALFGSGNVTVQPVSVPRRSGVLLRMECRSGCSTSTEVFLGTTCLPSAFSGLSTAPYQRSLYLSSPWSVPSVRTRPGTLVQDTSAPEGKTIWMVTLDASPLQPGTVVKVCVDYDGAAGQQLSGDSGATIYMAGVTALNRYGLPRSAQESLQLTCAEGCTNMVSEAYLAVSCDTSSAPSVGTGSNAPRPFPQADRTPRAVMTGIAPNFRVVLDTRALPLGFNYSLCTDLDGKAPALSSGNTGLRVHAAAVALRRLPGSGSATAAGASQHVATLARASKQTLRLVCAQGCSRASSALLVPQGQSCTSPAVADSMLTPDGEVARAGALGGYGSEAWRVELDTSTISAGRYRLCIDLDGAASKFAPGDTGDLVEVAPS